MLIPSKIYSGNFRENSEEAIQLTGFNKVTNVYNNILVLSIDCEID